MSTTSTHGGGCTATILWIRGRRGWCARRLQRLKFGHLLLLLMLVVVHVVEGGGGGRAANVARARRLVVVVVRGGAAGTAAGYAGRFHVAHWRFARREVRREVAGWVVRRAYVLVVLLLKKKIFIKKNCKQSISTLKGVLHDHKLKNEWYVTLQNFYVKDNDT